MTTDPPTRITDADVRFHPATNRDQRPALEVAGAMVFAYLDPDTGGLRVTVDTEGSDLYHNAAGEPAVTVAVNNGVVWGGRAMGGNAVTVEPAEPHTCPQADAALIAEARRLTGELAGVAAAARAVVFGTSVARSLVYTERPEALVGIVAERIWSNLDAYFTTGDWPDRRRSAAEVDAEEFGSPASAQEAHPAVSRFHRGRAAVSGTDQPRIGQIPVNRDRHGRETP